MLLLLQSIELERRMHLIASLFIHVSVQLVSLLFILLVALLSMHGNGRDGIVIASLLRDCYMAILIPLHEARMLIMAQSFFGVQSCILAVVSSGYLVLRHYYLLTSLILAAAYPILHFPFLNCLIVSGDAGGLERLIGYYGGNLSTSPSFEHCLADAYGFLLERVLWPGVYGHVRARLIVHLEGIIP